METSKKQVKRLASPAVLEARIAPLSLPKYPSVVPVNPIDPVTSTSSDGFYPGPSIVILYKPGGLLSAVTGK